METDMAYICEVYRTGSFSQAARNLFMTQPALSIAVRRVEEAIGAPLFERGTQKSTCAALWKSSASRRRWTGS